MNKDFIIQYLPIAQQDLEEILSYIEKDNMIAAASFIDEIDKKISHLAQFPYFGEMTISFRLIISDKKSIKQFLMT